MTTRIGIVGAMLLAVFGTTDRALADDVQPTIGLRKVF
jgi:hypothetical protein